ncbi:MAG: hypothetical protein ACOCW8_02290 [bacterium]
MPNPKLLLILAIVIITMLSGSYANAQDSYLKGRWSVKLSVMPKKVNTEDGSNIIVSSPYMLGNVSYGLFNSLELGASLGINFHRMMLIEQPNQGNPNNTTIATGNFHPIAELFFNFHPLTYFFEEKEPRFDLYISARVGGTFVSKKFIDSGVYEYVQLGGGLGYYITKRIGIFSEYNHQLDDWTSRKISGWRFGLTAKF